VTTSHVWSAKMSTEKKDYSTAILEKKKSPNRVMVDDTHANDGDSAQDENSVVYIHPDLMEELGFFRGDCCQIRGKKT